MSNVGLNLSVRAGEGGADVLSFGQLDRAANLMYQEQKKAELTAAKSFQDADTLLQKELGGIRSADEDEIFNLYKEVADARKELHFNPNVQKDVKVFAEKQKNAALKEATLRQRIAKSKETKKNLESTSKFDLNDFDPDKIKDYPSYLNMPTSELEKIGANVPQYFMNQGVDLSKLAQWKKNAMGGVQKVKFGEEVESADKYNLEQKIIGRMNDPVQFFNNLSSNFASKEAAYTARTLAKQMTPQQKTYIQTRFNEIPEEDFKAKWGVSKQDLLNKRGASDDYANEYLVLESMQHAVDNLPKEVEIKRRKNDKFVDEKKYEDWLKKNEITSSQATRRAYISRAANGKENEPVFYYDSYGEIDKKLDSKKGGSGIAINELSATTQENVLNIAKKSLGQSNVDNSEITIAKDANGEIGLYKVNIVEDKQGKNTAYVGEKISKLTDLDLNYSNAPSVKEKREISQKQNSGKKQPNVTPKKDPLNLFNK